MASYKAPKRVFKIVDFPEEMGEGLVVRARSVALGKLLDLQSLSGLINKTADQLDEQDLKDTQKLFHMFADCLVDWNLVDDDDEPVPPTFEGLMTQDFDWVNQLIEVWITAAIGVSAPLASSSTGGGRSEAAQLPMVPLSRSRAS